MAARSSVTSSCPGKVLIVGGYLVLEEGTPGLVVSTTARFFSTVSLERTLPSLQPQQQLARSGPFIVRSPQFGAEWLYDLPLAPPHVLVPRDASRTNPYVAYAVDTALAALAASAAGVRGLASIYDGDGSESAIVLTLRADNDFYSQRAHLLRLGLPVNSASLASLPRFMACPTDPVSGAAVVSKTGLGSSAALVTSVAAATLSFFSGSGGGGLSGVAVGGAVQHAESSGAAAAPAVNADLVHSVAQVAHGCAQGKIGSGFDVCSATYGSLRFSRIPPSVLGAIMEEADAVFRSSRAEISAADADASASEAPIAAAAAASLHDGDISSSSSRNSSSSISAVVDTHVSSAPSALPRYLAFGRLLAELPGPSSPSATLALTEHPAPFVTSGSSSNTAPYASSGSSTCAAAPVSSGGSSAANAWRFSAAPFGLPRGISLILADVAGGSETPSMVRKILEWRDRNVDSSGTGAAPPATAAAAAAAAAPPALTSNGNDGSGGTTAGAATAAAGVVDVSDDISVFPKSPAEVWQQLRTANAEVECSLLRLRALYDPTSTSTSSSAGGNGGGTGAPATAGVGDSTPAPLLTLEQYDAQLARAASKRFSEWGTAAEGSNPNATADETKPNAKLGEFAVERALSNVARAFRTARALLRHMGNEAGVPVEPPPQTALADATLNVPGVVAAGVPGAGGYDALFAVIIEVEGATPASSAAPPVLLTREQQSVVSATVGDSAPLIITRVRSAVESVWLDWHGGGLTPLLLRNGPAMGEQGAGVQLL